MGEKGLIGTTIKDTWTKTRRGGDRGGMGGKGRKLYLNNNKIQKYLKKDTITFAKTSTIY